MNEPPNRDDPNAIEAALELASVRQEARVARAMLVQLQQAVVQAMGDVEGSAASRLRAANQQLVCSALQAQSDADELRQSLGPATVMVLERDHDLVHLRQANEQLVVSAIGEQELRVGAEQAQMRQTQFLSFLAHELRSPLAPLRMAADLMERLPATELPRVHAIIEREVVHLTRLIGDLLDIARINSGKMHINRSVVSMVQIVDGAVNACRTAMDLRQQHFDIHLPTVPANVQGDPVRLAQVVRNLLDNASKYTDDGGHINLSVVLSEDRVVLTVTDDGIGIDPQAVRAIFDPYVQEKSAIGFNAAGLGIGLAIVRELVEAHEGTVVATSAGKGMGSQFVVSLPLYR